MRKILLGLLAASFATPAAAGFCTDEMVRATWTLTFISTPGETCRVALTDKFVFNGSQSKTLTRGFYMSGTCQPVGKDAYKIDGVYDVDPTCKIVGTLNTTKGSFVGRVDDNGALWIGSYTNPQGATAMFMAWRMAYEDLNP